MLYSVATLHVAFSQFITLFTYYCPALASQYRSLINTAVFGESVILTTPFISTNPTIE